MTDAADQPGTDAAPRRSLPRHVRVGEDVIWQQVEGQVVLLELNAARYYTLDAVGSKMWEALLESADVDTARARLLDTFDVDDATLRRDLAELIERLAGSRLLVVAGSTA